MKAERLLKRLGTVYDRLTEEQINGHKRAWVRHFVPPEMWQKAKECNCLPSDERWSDYLWHTFSFELVECLRGDDARTALHSAKSGGAILLSNWDDAGYYVSCTAGLTATALEEVDDVVLTCVDFSWTYAKTHEAELGPYFLNVQ